MSEWKAWSLGSSSVGELRLDAARKAYKSGEPIQAIIEAEELLEEEPDNAAALMLVGEASLDTGAFGTARIAFSQLLEVHQSMVQAWSGLALACFELTDLEACISACESAIELDSALPEPWYYLAVAQEYLGKDQEADAAFRQAASLDLSSFPYSPPFPEGVWTQAIEQACLLLPEEMRAWYGRIPIELKRFPELEVLRSSQPPLSPASGALYDGTPPPIGFGNPWATRPAQVCLYKRNLERGAPTQQELPRIIARALRQEALDWLGLPDVGNELLPDRAQAEPKLSPS